MIDPNDTFEYTLLDDVEKPVETRPAFIFRYVSGTEYRTIRRLFKQSFLETDEEKHFDCMYEAIKVGLVNWRNTGIDFDLNKIADVINNVDAIELREQLLEQMTISQVDKKKLGLALLNTTNKSASGTPILNDAPNAAKPTT